MQRRRVLEMLGSFVLGGALVTCLYELGGRTPAVATEPLPAAAAEVEASPAEPSLAGEVAQVAAAEPAPPVPGDPADPYAPRPDGTYGAFPPIHDPPAELDAAAEAKYPKHGLVTGVSSTCSLHSITPRGVLSCAHSSVPWPPRPASASSSVNSLASGSPLSLIHISEPTRPY